MLTGGGRVAAKPHTPQFLMLSTTCCHTFRATGITAYLSNGGTLEHAQQIAAHASPKTTKLYDRTADTISLDEIERIVI
jgi:integrase/recombinase XerD